ncbi:hypothetical protein K461DRAFT_297487 [Myriangium duriaei CBS 260.36]|uniref:Hikeshi-like domain-containing protein n=1 Tax=Myriangium duriaei CBS 260.36 TaxID=1168546 RepID=A0A9P4IV26_9PEZI|nr:hypothetical protein K461DRAFT_297487 [Myriangium duriaei CBS 260.36]
MFALLLPSRPLQSANPVSQTQYTFTVPSSPPFSHLAIFLLPDASLPPDVGATVWIQLPSSPDFRLLGALGPNKPSAIYRLRSPGLPQTDGEGDVMLDAPSDTTQQGDITIGVQIEPAARVEEQLAALRDQRTSAANSGALVKAGAAPVETKVLAQRIIGNAFNFLSSFGSDMIPLKAFQDWWKKFEGKIERDPGFLEREQG